VFGISYSVLASVEETVNGTSNRYYPSLIICAAVEHPRSVTTKRETMSIHCGILDKQRKQTTISTGKRRRPASPTHPSSREGYIVRSLINGRPVLSYLGETSMLSFVEARHHGPMA
jgi:hypothetical protein